MSDANTLRFRGKCRGDTVILHFRDNGWPPPTAPPRASLLRPIPNRERCQIPQRLARANNCALHATASSRRLSGTKDAEDFRILRRLGPRAHSHSQARRRFASASSLELLMMFTRVDRERRIRRRGRRRRGHHNRMLEPERRGATKEALLVSRNHRHSRKNIYSTIKQQQQQRQQQERQHRCEHLVSISFTTNALSHQSINHVFILSAFRRLAEVYINTSLQMLSALNQSINQPFLSFFPERKRSLCVNLFTNALCHQSITHSFIHSFFSFSPRPSEVYMQTCSQMLRSTIDQSIIHSFIRF